MQFSIVISTYNRLNLLKRAINSVLNQTVECEIVVVDDCSSDATSSYIEGLQQQRIIYHRNPINQGHAATVNTGVAKASGDWIKFLDDDDYLAPNCIEQMTKAIDLHPQAVICSCIAAQVDEQEAEISRTRSLSSELAYFIPQADIHYGMLLELVPFGTPAQVACRRDALIQTGGWDSQFELNCDDIDSWIRVSQLGDAIFLNQCLSYRTVWTGAHNQKFSLLQRMNTNILMKEKIYTLVNPRHRANLPNLPDIKTYLRLHWILVALKQRDLQSLFSMLDASLVSPGAWKMLSTATLSRSSLNMKNSPIRRISLPSFKGIGG